MKSNRFIWIFSSLLVITSIILILLLLLPSSSKGKLRIGYIKVTHCLPLYVAYEKGFFKENGIDVTIEPKQGGPLIVTGVVSGDYEIGFSNIVSLILAYSEGNELIPVSGGPIEDSTHRDHALLVLDNSKIKYAKDLEGKLIAINSRKNIDHLMLLEYFSQNMVKWDDNLVKEIPFPRMQSNLETSNVDVVASAEPFITNALLTDPGIKVFDWNYVAIRKETFVSCFFAQKKYVKEHKKEIEAFQNALRKAIEIINSDPSYARNILKKYLDLADEVSKKLSLPKFSDTIPFDNVVETEQLLLKNGLLAKSINYSNLIMKEQ